jgi:hypothetical protein
MLKYLLPNMLLVFNVSDRSNQIHMRPCVLNIQHLSGYLLSQLIFLLKRRCYKLFYIVGDAASAYGSCIVGVSKKHVAQMVLQLW